MKKKNVMKKFSALRMETKRCIVLAILSLLTFTISAQNGTWYFGTNAGMSFTNAGPVPLAGSAMNQSEGCASVVDASNNVVMYTDGIKIWNGIHTLQVASLGGAASSTQSAIIVPIPGTGCRAYYIFTTSAAETNYGTFNSKKGLRVSLVNVSGVAPNCTMTIAAGNQDINLLTGSYAGDLVAEKLAAVSDGSGGYWVTTHGVGLYQSYSGGTFNTPVNITGEANFYTVHVTTSTTTIPALTSSLLVTSFPNGQHRSTVIGGGVYSGQGQLKFNTLGTKIGCAMTGTREVQLYDFNPSTGAVTNQVLLSTTFTSASDDLTYGLEFSANGNYMYVSTTFGTNNRVYQLDITSNNDLTIATTKTAIAFGGPSFTYYFGALQIGPDNRIYVAIPSGTALDVITAPNQLACAYTVGGAPIAGTCNLGLPSVVRFTACEGNLFTDCQCAGRSELSDLGFLDANGATTIGVLLNSAIAAKKIKITLVNYNQITKPGCEACIPSIVESYGTITNTPIILGTPSTLTPYTNPGGVPYSRELVWGFPTPQVVNQIVMLNLQFPPVGRGCPNADQFCLKIEYVDADCHICETALYLLVTDGQNPFRLENENGQNENISTEQLQAIKTASENMQVYPNPAANSITVEMPAGASEGKMQIYDSYGKLIMEQVVTGPVNVINTESLPAGLYSVRYTNGKKQYANTLMISK